MSDFSAPMILLSAVGLTRRWLAAAPRLAALAQAGWSRPLREGWPAVTSTAQATLLTGRLPSEHGIVANGWLFRDTREVRFWQQSNALIQGEPLYATARRRAERRGRTFRAAKLFWWYNQGADVAYSVTPKPHYGADGSKAFAITGTPAGFAESLEKAEGSFPFSGFWGPRAGRSSTDWIARVAAQALKAERPDLMMVYLPHLDYQPQRLGPSGCDMSREVATLDELCAPLLDAAKTIGARVWVFGEYSHCDVQTPILINRELRRAGLLAVRPGPYGEMLDTFGSRALAACDHQLAHVYVSDPADVPRVHDLIEGLDGVERVVAGSARAEFGLDHERSGELIAMARPGAWFAYPYWLDDRQAPDFARTVDIHRKPGYDPCELFFDPAVRLPAARVAGVLARRAMGFRALMKVVPLDPSMVRGSHGRPADDDEDRPLLIGDGPPPPNDSMPLTAARDWILRGLGLGES